MTVELTHKRLCLFRNSVITSPTGRPEYSVATRWDHAQRAWATSLYALSDGNLVSGGDAVDEKHGELTGLSEYDNGAQRLGPIRVKLDAESMDGLRRPPANTKAMVADISYRLFPRQQCLNVEVPMRYRSGAAVLGPMRRNETDLFYKNAYGETVALDIGGRKCECVWVRKNREVRELRIASTDALVCTVRDLPVGFLNGRTLSPNTHISIQPDVVATYLANECAYTDDSETPRVFAGPAVREEIVTEVLVAHLLRTRLRERKWWPLVARPAEWANAVRGLAGCYWEEKRGEENNLLLGPEPELGRGRMSGKPLPALPRHSSV